jgi:chemotaxis signal transduction protein
MRPEDNLGGTTNQSVLIFPAMTPRVSNKKINFLFSVNQVEDILRQAPVRPVPFSPPFVEGIAWWQDAVVPVMSLEACLGMETAGPKRTQRLMVVRSAVTNSSGGTRLRSMLRVDSAIRMLPLPSETISVTDDGWLPKKCLVRGIYEWEREILVVPYLEKLLSGSIEIEIQKNL